VTRKSFLIAALAMLSAAARAADYTVMALPATRQAKVTVKLAPGEVSYEFRMPAWAPGDYELFDYGTRLSDVRFYLGNTPVAPSRGEDPNLWTMAGGADRVEYLVAESRGNFSPNLRVTAVETFVSGPGVFGWFKDHADQAHTLSIVHEEGMKVAIALPLVSSAPKVDVYRARNYDVLIDSPFSVSRSLRTRDFTVAGKRHVVAVFNQPEAADLDAFASVCKKAAESALLLFGELPYESYWFLFDMGGPGGGLEHLDSARMGIGTRATAEQTAGLIFHEYFHAFNVKRIRSKPLGPFDYTKPAVTGALWWLEGVTDYYADVLMVRSGLETRESFLRSMGQSFNGFHRNPAHTRASADESSRRAWDVRGSQGYAFSYYTKGRLIGMALDLAVRNGSGNKRSLDDVVRDLYEETKGKDGFSETRIRELCIKHGGEKLGPLYDALVMQPVRMPIEGVLEEAGLALGEGGLTVGSETAVSRTWPMPVKG
jgi:predicted metalloprotease with PDZ domain